jgi:HlyD family secretion protein
MNMNETEQSLRKIKRFGMVLVAMLALAVFGWGAQARIAGAVIAAGQVAILSDPKVVQHLDGGIVAAIYVRDGNRVKEGDPLIRLDDTEIKARLEIITSKLHSMLFEQARLEAERDRVNTLEIPVALVGRAHEPELRRIYDAQQKLLTTRHDGITGKRRQLEEQVIQLQSQIDGLVAQHAAKSKKATILKEELDGLSGLNKKGLVQKSRLTGLQRESADLDAEIAQLEAETARLKGKISETELRIIEIDESWREKVLAELVDVRTEVTSLKQEQIAELARLHRVDVRAPQAGLVHEMTVHAEGAVIGGGQPVLTIVPDDEELVVRVRVAPQDIDQVSPGQEARVVFSAFSQDDLPEIWGKVISVGADLSTDEVSGQSFYRADVSVPPDGIVTLEGQALKPGMPADAFIQTRSRTALNYLLKPLSGHIDRAFRD